MKIARVVVPLLLLVSACQLGESSSACGGGCNGASHPITKGGARSTHESGSAVLVYGSESLLLADTIYGGRDAMPLTVYETESGLELERSIRVPAAGRGRADAGADADADADAGAVGERFLQVIAHVGPLPQSGSVAAEIVLCNDPGEVLTHHVGDGTYLCLGNVERPARYERVTGTVTRTGSSAGGETLTISLSTASGMHIEFQRSTRVSESHQEANCY